MEISLQLYTVREETAKDFIGTLEKVAGVGYTGVEFAGYGDITAKEMKANLDRLGLKAVGSHVPVDRLKNNLAEEIEYNLEIGNRYIVCPWAKYEGADSFKAMAGFLNKVGAECKKSGLQLCYHNHAFEFEKFDGTYGLDIIYGNTDPELVKAELDTYWVKYAGIEPTEYITKYSGRCALIHLKDMEGDAERAFAEVGEGIIDIASIIKTGIKAGAKHFIVEQDRCKRPSLESIGISYTNLSKMNL